MNLIEKYYLVLVMLQLAHSQEEIWTRFDERWPIWKMSRRFFVAFEILFSILIVWILFDKQFPGRLVFMAAFNVLMFANGIWHLVWAGVERKYVPGLVTAPFLIIAFLTYYFGVLI